MRIFGMVFVALLIIAPAQALAADGAALYASNCASCHGPDGKADTPAAKAMSVPPVAGHDAAATVESVRTNEKHKVPAGALSDEELQAIADHLASM